MKEPENITAIAMALAYAEDDEGLKLLHCIASTADVGLLGAFEELIPQGLCFIQLWSAGLILEGIVAGLLGIQPDALNHSLTIAPNWPSGWDEVQLNGLNIGAHQIDLTLRPASLELRHRVGEHPLSVIWRSRADSVCRLNSSVSPTWSSLSRASLTIGRRSNC